MLKCTLNGRIVEVKEGSTIMEAFKQAGQDIAHYCWHPGLSIAGVCRLCMVKIEGNPKLQIACNTLVTDGMVISNRDEEVKEAVKWGLDFHLINHPLDCPICDQAGECGLQDQYMQYGKYDPEMAEHKVNKRKVIDLGERVVLDSERCILCSRCVRFTEEVTKTNELGIFNRGDRSEVGTFQDKPLNNNYSVNTVDICPVGALTSKDFRFKQRVWFLKHSPTICTGCSTGCNVDIYHNKQGFFRLKPRYNPEINGYWMCDVGRDTYKHLNRFETVIEGPRENKKVRQVQIRLLEGQVVSANGVRHLPVAETMNEVRTSLKKYSPQEIALVVTGQHTTEEITALVKYFTQDLKSSEVYYWINNPETFDNFDGLLFRGDRNPNSKGALRVLAENKAENPWANLSSGVAEGKIKAVVVLGPENISVFPDFEQRVAELSRAEVLVWGTACVHPALNKTTNKTILVPLRTYVEKSGTFVNYQGKEQKVSPVRVVVDAAVTGEEFAQLLKEGSLPEQRIVSSPVEQVRNEFLHIRGEL